jgi:uncharacterized membrane protein SirB2
MALIEYYLPLKDLHITLAVTSVSLFVARGAGVLAGRGWPMRPLARWGSVAIDTLLACAGALLWWLLSFHPLRESWLGAKLALIVCYVLLGSMALKRARRRKVKAVFFVLALLCVGALAAAARLKDARAPWLWLTASARAPAFKPPAAATAIPQRRP